jgi:hypothetical protein
VDRAVDPAAAQQRSFAALTMASTSSVVMSAVMTVIGRSMASSPLASARAS